MITQFTIFLGVSELELLQASLNRQGFGDATHVFCPSGSLTASLVYEVKESSDFYILLHNAYRLGFIISYEVKAVH